MISSCIFPERNAKLNKITRSSFEIKYDFFEEFPDNNLKELYFKVINEEKNIKDNEAGK